MPPRTIAVQQLPHKRLVTRVEDAPVNLNDVYFWE
jgi:hypothetical protein